MPASAFPLSSLPHLYFDEEGFEYPVTVSPLFADGGRDINLDADQKVRLFRVRFDGLTQAQADLIDDHADEAKYNERAGSAYSFNLTIPSSHGGGTVSVRYAPGGYKRSHSKLWAQSRELLFEHRP